MEADFYEESEYNGSPTGSKLHESIESSIEIPNPLPPHTDPSLCRDQFLKTILREYNERQERITFAKLKSEHKIITLVQDTTPEGLALQKLMDRRSRSILAIQQMIQTNQLNLEREMMIFKSIIRQFTKAALRFLIGRLLKQLHLFENVWPGDTDAIPFKLFWWSVDFFLKRMFVNQLYLDVISMERSENDLDCMKFRTDISEISRIITALRDDFCSDRDLCAGALSMINGANYPRNSKWVNEVPIIGRIQENLIKTVIAFQGSPVVSNETCNRQYALQVEEDAQDATTPIELRYRINWVRTGVEQCMLKIHQKDEILERQLADTVKRMSQDALVYHYTEFVYTYQIHKYRNELNEWQQRYDNDFENVELQCTQILLSLEKIKDEHKFYSEQLVMMKRRIAEVTHQIEMEKQQQEREEHAMMLRELDRARASEVKRKKKEVQEEHKIKKKGGKK